MLCLLVSLDFCPIKPTPNKMHSRELLTECMCSTKLATMLDVDPKTYLQYSGEHLDDWPFFS